MNLTFLQIFAQYIIEKNLAIYKEQFSRESFISCCKCTAMYSLYKQMIFLLLRKKADVFLDPCTFFIILTAWLCNNCRPFSIITLKIAWNLPCYNLPSSLQPLSMTTSAPLRCADCLSLCLTRCL